MKLKGRGGRPWSEERQGDDFGSVEYYNITWLMYILKI
jgi:hypothetical protein